MTQRICLLLFVVVSQFALACGNGGDAGLRGDAGSPGEGGSPSAGGASSRGGAPAHGGSANGTGGNAPGNHTTGLVKLNLKVK